MLQYTCNLSCSAITRQVARKLHRVAQDLCRNIFGPEAHISKKESEMMLSKNEVVPGLTQITNRLSDIQYSKPFYFYFIDFRFLSVGSHQCGINVISSV